MSSLESKKERTMKLDNGREYREHLQIPKPVLRKIKETKLSERGRKIIDVILEQTLGYESLSFLRLIDHPLSS